MHKRYIFIFKIKPSWCIPKIGLPKNGFLLLNLRYLLALELFVWLVYIEIHTRLYDLWILCTEEIPFLLAE